MEKVMVKNAADPKQVKRAKQMGKLVSDKDKDDLLFLLSTPQGRRYCWKLLKWCGLYQSPEDSRGDATQRNIGAQNIARKILADIVSVDQRAWLKMQEENLKEGEIDV